MEKDNEYANIYQQMPGGCQSAQCCGGCGSGTLSVPTGAGGAAPSSCHCLQIHAHPAGHHLGAATHILHIHPHGHAAVVHHHPAAPHLHHHGHPHHPRIQGLSSDSDYRSVYSSSSSLYSMPVFHQPPPPPPPPPPLPPQNPQPQQPTQLDPGRLQMRSPVSSSAATYSDSSQYGTHSPIALIRYVSNLLC